jgi:hypothetical protein
MADEKPDLQAVLDEHRRAVDTEYFDLSIRELVRMVKEEEIIVAPSYQRQFRWKSDVQSALIESLLLGLPIPAVFVATNKDSTWDVVDGLQRISTLLRFYGIDVPKSEKLRFSNDKLVLDELSQLKEFSGLSYEDLPKPIQLTLGKRYLRVQVLSDKSDADVRFELFRRLNAGAVKLSSQEIRSAVFEGPFNSLVDELSLTPEYVSLLKLQAKYQNDGTAAEIVLKFFAYLDEASKFDGQVTKFLNNYMKRRVKDTDLEADRQLFLRVIRFLREVVDGPFKREKVPTTPINQLEGVLVGVGRIFRGGNEPKIPPAGWENDAELVKASTSGTNNTAKLRDRIRRSEEIFS